MMRRIIEKTCAIDDVQRVLITTASTDVELIQTEESDLKAQIWTNAATDEQVPVELMMSKKGDALEIRIEQMRQNWLRMGVLTSFGSWGARVVIQLPTRIYDQIRIDGKSSDFSVRQLLANRTQLAADSGDIEMETCSVNQELSVATSSGDIQVQDTLVKGHFHAHATSGDMRLEQVTAEEIRLRTHSGDIRVTEFRGGLDAMVNSGDLDIDSDLLSGDLNLESRSGDVQITFRTEPESLSLDYHSSSGDGDVRIAGLTYDKKSEHRIIGQKGDGTPSIRVRTRSGDFSLR